MSLLRSAERAGILGRACELVDEISCEATAQIASGALQIRAYRIWYSRGRK
jgi:hypothetical protein